MKKTTMKIINIIIIIMLIILIMPLQIVKSSTNYNKNEYSNMLQNSGFEEGIKYWNIWNDSGNLNIEIDEEVKKEGVYSIKLFNNNYNARGSISQIIENNDNNLENMVLEQYIKTLNFIGSFKIRVDFLDDSWNKLKESDIKEVNITDSNEWNKHKYWISSKGMENVKYIKIEYLFDNSKGNIWIDEIRLEKTGEIHSFGEIQNGGFEEGTSYWTKWSNNANIEIDNNILKEGNSSLRITSKSKGRASIVQNIKIPDDEVKSVNISQWIKTENILGNGIKLRVRFIDGQGNEIGNKKILALEIGKNTEWSNLKYDIGLPQNNIRELQIEYLYDNCEGIMWIDEIYAYFSGDDIVENMILNPSFEATVDDVIDGWKSWGDISLKLDTDIKNDKSNSLLIYSNDKSNGAIYQSIDISQDIVGKDIRLKQYIKTNNVESKEIKATMKFLDKNNDEVENSQNYIIELNDSKEWNELNINFNIPNNDEITGIILEYRFREFLGEFWIDNLFMENYRKISDININPSYIEVEVNKNIEIETNVIPEDSTYKKLNYEISDDSIAIINNKIITGKKSGITKLIISEDSNNLKKEIPIIVLGENFEGMQSEKKQNIKLNESYNDYIGDIYEKYEVFIKPVSGYLILSEDGYIEYYPQSVGNDSFVIKVKDKNNNVKLIQYAINISDNSFKALGEDFLISLTQNEQFKTGKIITNSFNNRNIKFSILKYPENGEILIDENGSYKYTPNEGFSGYDSVKVELSSGLRLKEVVIGTIFVSPSINNINNVHPKIILNDKLINRINDLITNEDTNMSQWYKKIKIQSESILNKPVIKYNKVDHEKIDTTSKQYIQDLSFMYLLTNDKKYADRAWLEIENVCNYNDWNNGFLLDTAALSIAVSIGYDWLYNYLSIDQREFIEKNIKSKSLNLFKEYYNENSHFFIENDANWNIVANSSAIVSSIAISNPENKEYCNEIISLGLKSLQNSIIDYYSDGNSYEGPEYWAFSTEYLMYAVETAENIFDEGYFNNIIDFYKLGEVPNHIVGIDGVFNYGDSRSFDIAGYLSLWLADKTQSPELVDYHKKNIIKNNSISIFDIIWYDPNIYNKEVELTKDKYFPETGIITMKSSTTNNEIGFVGIKGGKNGVAHGDLDIGSFIFERDGIRWAIDLGKDDYSLPGYFDNEEYGDRWSYYKKRAEGNNTLTIGSKVNEDQIIGASAIIIENNLNIESPSVVMDITQAYKEAIKVTRSFTFENREDLIIEDNFILKSEEEIVWQMHTDSDVEISEDSKSVTLRKEGRTCIIQLENEDLRFEVIEVNSITSTLQSKTNEDINNIRKIFVKTKTQKGNFKIRFKSGIYENSSINMIKNAGFESELQAWNKWISSGSFKAEADNTVAKEGKASAKLYSGNTSIARGSISNSIDVTKYLGKTFKLTQWIKSSDLDGNLQLRIKFSDEKWAQVGELTVKSIAIKGTEDWKEVEYTINVPTETRIKYLLIEYLYDNAKGTVWIDDIKIEETIEEPKVGFENAGFESELQAWNKWISSGSFKAEADNTVAKEGKASAKLYSGNTSIARGSISNSIDVTKYLGKTFKLTQWIKSSDLDGNLQLRIKFSDEKWAQVGELTVKSIAIKGTEDWKEVEYTINVPTETRIKYLLIEYLYDNAKGTVWIDDIKIEETIEEPKVGFENAGFESELQAWNKWISSGSFKAEADNTVAKEGKASAKLYSGNTSIARGSISNSIDVTKYLGKTFKLTQWIKSSDLDGNLQLRIKFSDEKWAQVGELTVKSIAIKGTEDWKEVEYTINVPTETRIKYLLIEYLYDNAKGTVWIDDIKIEETIEEPKVGFENAGFESELQAWNKWISSGSFKAEADNTVAKEGKASAKLYSGNTSIARGSISNSIDVTKYLGKAFKLTQWIKSSDLDGNLQLRIKFSDEKWAQVGELTVKSIAIKGTEDWKEVEYTINVPTETRIKYLLIEYLYDNAKGTVWIDDINIEETIEEPKVGFENAGFESELQAWNKWISSGSFKAEADNTVAKEGKASAKLYSGNTSIARGSISNSIDVTKYLGKAFKLTQWIKSSDLDGNLQLRIKFSDEKWAQVGELTVKSIAIKGTEDWKEVEYTINVPTETRIKYLLIEYLYDNAKGTVWIDDIKIEETIEEPKVGFENAGFESELQAWNKWISSGSFKAEADNTVAKEGKASAKLYSGNTSIARGSISNSIDVTKYLGKTFKLTQWIKSSDLDGNLQLRIKFSDEKWAQVGELTVKSIAIKGTEDWKEVEYTINVPTETRIKYLLIEYLYDNAKGTVWIDDIKIEETIEEPKVGFENAGFESELQAWNKWISSGSFKAEADNTVAKEGKASAKLYSGNTSIARGSISNSIDVTKYLGKTFKLTQWIKSSDLDGNLQLRIKFSDEKWAQVGELTVKSIAIKGTEDWKEVEYTINVPTETRIKYLLIEYLYDNAKGTVWIDDIKIEETIEEPKVGFENAGFESELQAWNKWISSGSFKAEADNTVAKEGKASAKLYSGNTSIARGSISNSIDVTKYLGKTFKLTQWIKSSDLDGNLQLRIKFSDEKWAQVGELTVKSIAIKGTEDWKEVEYTINVPTETRIKYLLIEYLYDNAKGTVWIDDIKIEETIEEPKVGFENAGFESELQAWNKWISSGSFKAEADNTVAKEGKASAKLYSGNTSIARGSISNSIDVTKYLGKTFKLTQWIKSSDLDGNLQLRIKFSDEKWAQVGELTVKSIAIKGTEDWKEVEYTINVPTETRIKYLLIEYLYDNAKGTVWIDDIKIEETIEEPKVGFENAGFESELQAWNKWISSGSFKAEADNTVAKEGKASAKLYSGNTSIARGSISNSIDVTKYLGKTFKLTQWIKSSDLDGNLQLRIKFSDEKWAQVGELTVKSIAIKGTEDWKEVEYTINVPTETRIKYLLIEYLYDNAKGTVWIDDINIEETIEEPKVGFENEGVKEILYLEI